MFQIRQHQSQIEHGAIGVTTPFLDKHELVNIGWIAAIAARADFGGFSLAAHTPTEHMLVATFPDAFVQVGAISVVDGFAVSITDLDMPAWTPYGPSAKAYVPGGAVEINGTQGDINTMPVAQDTSSQPPAPTPVSGVNFVQRTYKFDDIVAGQAEAFHAALQNTLEPRILFFTHVEALFDKVKHECGNFSGIERDVLTLVDSFFEQAREKCAPVVETKACYEPDRYVCGDRCADVSVQVYHAVQLDIDQQDTINAWLGQFDVQISKGFGNWIKASTGAGWGEMYAKGTWVVSRPGNAGYSVYSHEEFLKDFVKLEDLEAGDGVPDYAVKMANAYHETLQLTFAPADDEDPKAALDAYADIYMSPEATWDDLISVSMRAKQAGAFTPGQMIEADASEVLDEALKDQDNAFDELATTDKPVVDQIKGTLGLNEGDGSGRGNVPGYTVVEASSVGAGDRIPGFGLDDTNPIHEDLRKEDEK